ncbi:heparinase II/III family protein, partial [Salmonella enterica]|uniref:heparinase II/III family protein n=1 Tax=Salmonella enterica TaxID=28901 RepID=UPI0039ED5259
DFYADIDYGTRPGVDIKVPWEMSRGLNLVRLGQAYRLTRDERYVQGVVAQAGDWIVQNPYLKGVNWSSAMEASIRSLNWLAA